MSFIENYYLYCCNSIILSKIIIKKLNFFPKIKKLLFIFCISLKNYKKNVILFYIIVWILFGSFYNIKNKKINDFLIFKFIISKIKALNMLFTIINIYFPQLENFKVFQVVSIGFLTKRNLIYKLQFLEFPIIIELQLLYNIYELITQFITYYKIQIHLFLSVFFPFCYSADFLLKFLKLSYSFKIKCFI